MHSLEAYSLLLNPAWVFVPVYAKCLYKSNHDFYCKKHRPFKNELFNIDEVKW